MKTIRCIERKYDVEFYFDDIYGQRYKLYYKIDDENKSINFSISMEYDNGGAANANKILYKDTWIPKDSNRYDTISYELGAFVWKAVETIGPVYRKTIGVSFVDPHGMYDPTDILIPPVKLAIANILNPALINLSNTLAKIKKGDI